MRLTELESHLADYGQRGYYQLEAFLLQLLKFEASAHGQKISLDQGTGSWVFDAYAPEGISDIKIPLAIEVSFTSSHGKLDKIFDKYSRFKRTPNEGLLILSLRAFTANDLEKFQSSTTAAPVFLWGPDEIQNLIDKHEEKAEALSRKLFSTRLAMAVSRSSTNWKEHREQIISDVCEKYVSGRFSLFLGAGVSSSAGLPDWDTLLNSLFVAMLTNDGFDLESVEIEQSSSIVKRLRQVDGPSTLMLARYLRRGLSSGSEQEQASFTTAVTTQLYALRDHRYSISSPLIKAIASLCTPGRTGAKIQAVVTYNFDDLVERELETRAVKNRSIFESVGIATAEELPIYHVHGFLPEDRSAYTNLNRATLVFSEEGYHKIYSEPYHWSNLIQLTTLKETTCLMIGLSLTDPNLRRLLEIVPKPIDSVKHFAFMRRLDYEKFTKNDGKNIVKAPVGTISKFLERHHSLNEAVMRELGINIIWYEEYDEIPKILQRIGNLIGIKGLNQK